MLKTTRNTSRLLRIALILAQENLHRSRRPGERLAAAFSRLGPAFIKLGQALSTRSDLIGEEMAADLGDLRDNLPPFPAMRARATIAEELGQAVEVLFTSFNDKPVAAASIAQVHRAVSKDGRDVAVKILRPGIEKAFARDLELFEWIAVHAQRRWPRLKPLEVVGMLKEWVFFELDLRFEAAAATELADNLKQHEPGFRVPAIDWALTSRRVLVTEWIYGIPINDVDSIRRRGINPDEVLAKAAKSLFSQVFQDGFFHADLHPGNLFVDKNGDVVAVDFGIMGRLDWNSRLYMVEILRGFLQQDYRRVAEMHFTAGYVPADKSVDAFAQACMAVGKPITDKPLNEISVAKLLGQMFGIAAEFEMETQPQLLLLQKTMMVTEGVGRMLNPNLNMWELARPLIEPWAEAQFGVRGKLQDAARQGGDIVRKFPLVLHQAETALKHLGDPGGIRLHTLSIQEINAGRHSIHRAWLRLAWATLAVLTLLSALWFLKL